MMIRYRLSILRPLTAAALLTGVACLGSATGLLESVTWSKQGQGLKINVGGRDLKSPKVMRVMGGRSLILEFEGGLEGKPWKESIGQCGVDLVQTAWFSRKPQKVRVHVKFDSERIKSEVKPSASGFAVLIGGVIEDAPLSPMDEAMEKLKAPTASPPKKVPQPAASDFDVLVGTPDPQKRKTPMDEAMEKLKVPASTTYQLGRPIKLTFFDTDVALVLKAISAQTGASIILASQEKVKVNLNLTAASTDEAVRATTAAAGLAFARAGSVYVVAAPTSLRAALVPYGKTVTVAVPSGSTTEMIARLQEALPLATFGPNGDKVMVTALPQDLAQVPDLVRMYAHEIEINKPVSEVFILTKAAPTDVAKIVEAVFPGLKIVATGEGSGKEAVGAVAISGRAADVSKALELAAKLDVEGSGSLGTLAYEVYNLKYTSAPSVVDFLKTLTPDVEAIPGPESFSPTRGQFSPLGAALRAATGAQTSGGGGGGNTQNQQPGTQGGATQGTEEKPGDRTTTLVLKGPRKSVDAALKLVATLDVKPLQVMVEVKVVETSPNFSKQLGINFSWSALRFFEVPAGTAFTGTPGIGPLSDFPTKPVGVGQFSRVPWSFQGLMNALITKGEARLLANPSVQVINNDHANIFIGDTIRARVAQANGLGGQTVDIAEFPVGIILLISPRVNADGDITMHVNPVVSTITAIGEDNIPQTSSREAETTVIVKDGETMVIGGLIRDEYSKIVSEVPILSQLPIIGELFKNRNTNHKHSEIVVTITPHIVKDTPKDK